MSRPNSYAGETDSKRLARLALYRRIQQLQPATTRTEGSAVVLAGPEAGEVGCLRDFLGLKPHRTYFVDWESEKGLDRARQDWPKVNTELTDVNNVVRPGYLKTPLALLHLDFMGYLNEVREDTLKQAAPLMAMWGMVFYTFFRGREKSGVGLWDKMKETKASSLDGKRFIGGARIIQKALGSNFVPVFALRYCSISRRAVRNVRQGSMGVLGFQKVPKDFQGNSHWMRMLGEPTQFGGEVPTDERLLQELLRTEALELRRQGHKSKEVSAILNMGAGKVAAWFAMQSRGTYNQ